MSKKTNKTSHVMDLLTNGASTDTDSPVAEAVSNQEKKNSDVQSHTVTPAKVTVVDEGSRNDRLSQEILGKLTEELEAETQKEAKTDKTSADQAAEPDKTMTEPGNVVAEPENIVAEPERDVTGETVIAESESTNAGETYSSGPGDTNNPQIMDSQLTDTEDSVSPETPPPLQDTPGETPRNMAELPSGNSQTPKENHQAPVKPENAKTVPKIQSHPIIPESQFNDRFADKEYRFINVMEQLLMRQNLEAVLTQYDVCTCPRCMSDVCALVLTGLPSKYVVTSRDSISPLISYYENKYKIPVLTELMKACDRVRQNPRHKISH